MPENLQKKMVVNVFNWLPRKEAWAQSNEQQSKTHVFIMGEGELTANSLLFFINCITWP